MGTTKRSLAGICTGAVIVTLVLFVHSVDSRGLPAGTGPGRRRTAGDAGGRRAVEAGPDELGPVGRRRREGHAEPHHAGEAQAGRRTRAGGHLRLAGARRRDRGDDRRPAAVSGHPARDHRRRDPDLVPRVHPHAPGLPEPQLHWRGRDLQRLPARSPPWSRPRAATPGTPCTTPSRASSPGAC